MGKDGSITVVVREEYLSLDWALCSRTRYVYSLVPGIMKDCVGEVYDVVSELGLGWAAKGFGGFGLHILAWKWGRIPRDAG